MHFNNQPALDVYYTRNCEQFYCYIGLEHGYLE